MERILLSFFCIFVISCDSIQIHKEDDSLKLWILNHQHQLSLDSDSIVQEHHDRGDENPDWIASTIANTIYAENSLGELAKKAGDSTKCIVVQLTFYKDLNKKRRIMIATRDSTCFKNFKNIILKTDSTNDFIFGKKEY